MTRKIFRSTVFLAVFVLLCALGVVMGVLYDHYTDVLTKQLKDELSLAATGTEQYGKAFLENVEADRFRLTWIDKDGTVLFDTQIDQVHMENHADRQEIRQALQTGHGSAVRTSSTITERTYYEAQLLRDGTVLRISTDQRSAWSLVIGMLWPVVLITLVAAVLAALLARQMAGKIVRPLNMLDLEQPLQNVVYPELSPLLHRIHRQHNQITAQMQALRQRADEFEQITSNMHEGLILLSRDGKILSINPTAKKLFAAKDDVVGKDFLRLDDNGGIRCALNEAMDYGHGKHRLSAHGREYKLDLSRIESDGEVIGVVVLAVDVTESLNAEQLRREFSANVSHELKTPLQGIIGSAELLESGMVKPQDTARFVGHIRQEATRLVDLVEDIIRLSQLDEGAEMPVEQVQLLPLIREVMSTLQRSAGERQVTIEALGSGFSVRGVRRLLYEMIYNLCDNAIKYNVPGGSVTVCAEGGTLEVTDTGIGIPAEHMDRVFERFYRVDKSHSKASGGTGLGLSIVKHTAAYHNATLHLESTLGQGTSVRVCFPQDDA